jgi:hypothetical protein
MEWFDDPAAVFPAPRDDEPPELRNRIVRELRDHLDCAYRRELVLCGNETEAEQRVLKKFGDPGRLARKLWLDAMQEKIMSQRWNLAVSSIMACACLASLAVVIVMTRDNRELNHLLLEQSRAANAALLAELSARRNAAAPASAPSLDWTPVKFRLVQSQRGGKPAAGFKVGLTGNLLDTAKQMMIFKETGPDGIADFGMVRPGEHNLAINSPWGEFLIEMPFIVLPGQPINCELPSPAAADESAGVSCVVELPPALRDRNVWLLAEATRARRNCDGTVWTHPASSIRVYFMIAPDGKVLRLPERLAENASSTMFDGYSLSFDGLKPGPFLTSEMVFGRTSKQDPFFSPDTSYFSTGNLYHPGGGTGPDDQEPRFWLIQGESESDAPAPTGYKKGRRHETAWGESGLRPFFLRVAEAPGQAELRLPEGRYRIENLVACEPPAASARPGYLRYNVIGGLISGLDAQTASITVNFRPEVGEVERQLRAIYQTDDDASDKPLGVPFREWSADLEGPADDSALEKRERLRAALLPIFEVEAGRANKWVIAVPERLTECVERFLAGCQKVPRPPVLSGDELGDFPTRSPRRSSQPDFDDTDLPAESPASQPRLVPSPENDEPKPVRLPDE